MTSNLHVFYCSIYIVYLSGKSAVCITLPNATPVKRILLDGLQSCMKGQQLLLSSNSKPLSIYHHSCSSTLCTAAQLLSSAAGSWSDIHSDSSDCTCKLFYLLFSFSFLLALHLLPSLPIAQKATALATKLPASCTHLHERNRQTKGDSR